MSDVEARGDDTGLVDASDKLDNDLAGAVVVNLLELANVACICKRKKINILEKNVSVFNVNMDMLS